MMLGSGAGGNAAFRVARITEWQPNGEMASIPAASAA
jgi:hypothetical protein